MKIKIDIFRVFCIFTLLMLVIGAGSTGVEAVGNDFDSFAGDELDRLQVEIIDLALESSDSLGAQRELIEDHKDFDPLADDQGLSADISGGVGLERDDDTQSMYIAPQAGLSFNYPLIDPNREVQAAQRYLAYREDQVSKVFNLEEEEKALVMSLNEELQSLIELLNEFNGQMRLLERLEERSSQLERMVESGIAEPENLWELDERIHGIETELHNLRSGQQMQINLIANNYGRGNREDMKEKLLALTDLFAVEE